MLYLLFAIPISISDVSKRKIPNIYLQLYAYLVAGLVVVRGIPDPIFLLLVLVILGLMAVIGLGMGDCKLVALVVVLLQLSADTDFLCQIFVRSNHGRLKAFRYKSVFLHH